MFSNVISLLLQVVAPWSLAAADPHSHAPNGSFPVVLGFADSFNSIRVHEGSYGVQRFGFRIWVQEVHYRVLQASIQCFESMHPQSKPLTQSPQTLSPKALIT